MSLALSLVGQSVSLRASQMPEEVRKSKLKHALASGGLYPIPVKEGSRIKPTPSGSMAVFSSGDSDAALSKGGGDPM